MLWGLETFSDAHGYRDSRGDPAAGPDANGNAEGEDDSNFGAFGHADRKGAYQDSFTDTDGYGHSHADFNSDEGEEVNADLYT